MSLHRTPAPSGRHAALTVAETPSPSMLAHHNSNHAHQNGGPAHAAVDALRRQGAGGPGRLIDNSPSKGRAPKASRTSGEGQGKQTHTHTHT